MQQYKLRISAFNEAVDRTFKHGVYLTQKAHDGSDKAVASKIVDNIKDKTQALVIDLKNVTYSIHADSDGPKGTKITCLEENKTTGELKKYDFNLGDTLDIELDDTQDLNEFLEQTVKFIDKKTVHKKWQDHTKAEKQRQAEQLAANKPKPASGPLIDDAAVDNAKKEAKEKEEAEKAKAEAQQKEKIAKAAEEREARRLEAEKAATARLAQAVPVQEPTPSTPPANAPKPEEHAATTSPSPSATTQNNGNIEAPATPPATITVHTPPVATPPSPNTPENVAPANNAPPPTQDDVRAPIPAGGNQVLVEQLNFTVLPSFQGQTPEAIIERARYLAAQDVNVLLQDAQLQLEKMELSSYIDAIKKQMGLVNEDILSQAQQQELEFVLELEGILSPVPKATKSEPKVTKPTAPTNPPATTTVPTPPVATPPIDTPSTPPKDQGNKTPPPVKLDNISRLLNSIIPAEKGKDGSFAGRLTSKNSSRTDLRTKFEAGLRILLETSPFNTKTLEDKDIEKYADAVILAFGQIKIDSKQTKGPSWILLNKGTKDISSFFETYFVNLVASIIGAMSTGSMEPLKNWYACKPEAMVWDADKFSGFMKNVAEGKVKGNANKTSFVDLVEGIVKNTQGKTNS